MNRDEWEDWKEVNADWWEPFLGFTIIFLFTMGVFAAIASVVALVMMYAG